MIGLVAVLHNLLLIARLHDHEILVIFTRSGWLSGGARLSPT